MTMGNTSAQLALRDPDVALMLRVRAGDNEAFQDLVNRYQGRLITVLRHVVGNEQTAEDLAQETFLRVYQSRAKYRGQHRFSTWIFTIAHNLAFNQLRNNARKKQDPLPFTESGSLPVTQTTPRAAKGPAPESFMDRKELIQAVQQALLDLNDRQRLAVVLNKFEDMGYEEIGKVMELGPAAVKSLLNRARVNLRERLTPFLDEASGQTILPMEADSPEDGGHE